MISSQAQCYYSECVHCIQGKRVWCGLSQTCVETETECHSPFGSDLSNSMDFAFSNVTWMIQTSNLYNITESGTSDMIKRLFTNKNNRAYNISNIRPLYQLPSHCYTGIITQTSQCSKFKLEMDRDYSPNVRNYIYPMWYQPRLKFNNESNLFYSIEKLADTIQVGFFFAPIFPIPSRNDSFLKSSFNGEYLNHLWTLLSNYNTTQKLSQLSYLSGYQHSYGSYLFSYLHHVFNVKNFRTYFNSNHSDNILQFYDLSIAGKPDRYYRLGFAFASPKHDLNEESFVYAESNGKLNSEVLGSQFQCTFVLANQIIYPEPTWKFSVTGPHMYLSLGLLVIITLWVMLIICGNSRLVEVDGKENKPRIFDRTPTTPKSNSLIHKRLAFAYDILKNYFLTNDNDLSKEVGSEPYYYFWFYRYIFIFLGICGFLNIVTLIPIFATTKTDLSFIDFSQFTAASLTIDRSNHHVFFLFIIAINFLVGLLSLLLVTALKYESRMYMIDEKINSEKLTATTIRHFGSLYTILVKNIPKEILSNEAFGDMFNEVILNGKMLSSLSPSKEAILEEKTKLEEQLAFIKQQFYLNEEKTQENRSAENQSDWQIRGTGYGFVTFFSLDHAQSVLNEFKAKQSFWARFLTFLVPFYSPSGLQLRRAPNPDDVIFSNFVIGTRGRALRMLTSSVGLLFAIIAVFTILGIGSVIQWLKHEFVATIDVASSVKDTSVSDLFRFLVDLLMEIPGLFVELLKMMVVALSTFVRYYSKTHQSIFIVGKVMFFIIASLIVFPVFTKYVFTNIIIIFSDYTSLYPQFDNLSMYGNLFGTDTISLLLILSFITKSMEYGILFIGSLATLVFTGKIVRPPFDYESSYGFKSAILIIIVLYGGMNPMIYMVGLFFFLLSYFLERFFIMFLYQRGRQSNGDLLSHVASNLANYFSLLPLTFVVFFPFVIKYYSDYSSENLSLPPYLLLSLVVCSSVILLIISRFMMKYFQFKASTVYLKKFEETRETGVFEQQAEKVLSVELNSLEYQISKHSVTFDKMKSFFNNNKIKKNQIEPMQNSKAKEVISEILNYGKIETLENDDIVNHVHKTHLLDLYRHPYFIWEAKRLKKKMANAARAVFLIQNNHSANAKQ
ncbi:hypothetical protein C9374_000877 [Naegleria lovaniensis]|uniref:CSC1/OSCA1-like cytosolic domain-containing protein n=1 Tax=Naegleria lovaniensis TaxID=51637 RepID=A0AA88GSF0_NAELO|nr:uncharacterized protein C9374_000877 [Naegleria lovaniensis]KAG2388027.1 hypothetical protein C9374_000877 [Naegleria lovaniensis]